MFALRRKRTHCMPQRTLLRFEALERRELLTVNILTNTPSPGDLSLVGDTTGNAITIQPATNPGAANTYTITANTNASGVMTQLQLNGVALNSSSYVVGRSGDLVTGNISVNLGSPSGGGGQNTLVFGFTSPPSQHPNPVQGNLTIFDNANDTNTIANVHLMQGVTINNVPTTNVTNTVTNTVSNVQIGLGVVINNGGNTNTTISNSTLFSNLTVNGPAWPVIAANLSLTNCTIVGAVAVNNNLDPSAGGPFGNSSTTIAGGWLESTLTIANGSGINSTNIGSSSAPTQIGGNPATTAQIVTITNGSGASWTQFSGASASPLTVMGGVGITNGASPAYTNTVIFTYTNTAGRVTVNNGGTLLSPSQLNSVNIQNSTLGYLQQSALANNPLIINNGTGYDVLSITNSTVPWGAAVDNTVNDLDSTGSLSPAAVWGSNTSIIGSKLGTGQYGPNINSDPLHPDSTKAGVAFRLDGDNGDDVVTIGAAATAASTIQGATVLNLNGGNNSVTFKDGSTTCILNVTTGAAPGLSGNDTVSITNAAVTNGLNLALEGVTNKVTISGSTLPDTNLYPVHIVTHNVPISSNTLTIDTSTYGKLLLGVLEEISGFLITLT